MHILFLTPAFPPFPGGGERYANALSNNLAQRGHQITVVTSSARRADDLWQGQEITTGFNFPVHENMRVLRCSLRPFPGGRNGLLAWRKAMVLISSMPGDQTRILQKMSRLIPPLQDLSVTLNRLTEPFDLVHGFNISWEYAMLSGQHFAQTRNIPFVATPFTHLGANANDRVARNSTMDHQRNLLYHAANVQTLTVNERDGLIALGTKPERITVVGSGVDSIPPNLPDATSLQKGYNLKKPYVIFVGQADYEKGAVHAAQAILNMNAEGATLNLIMVGQKSPSFARFIERLAPSEKEIIRPLGVVDETTKHALIRDAMMLLLPSRNESFGIVLLEAWAHKKPVIGARAGGIPAVIDDGENGLLIDFGDVAGLTAAIKRLLNNPNERQSMGTKGYQKVIREYSWASVTERVLAAYQNVLPRHP